MLNDLWSMEDLTLPSKFVRNNILYKSGTSIDDFGKCSKHFRYVKGYHTGK